MIIIIMSPLICCICQITPLSFYFQKFWGSQMDPRLAQYITNFLFGPLGNRSTVVEFQRFAELYVYCVRGTIDERISVLLASLGQAESDTSDIAYPLIKEVGKSIMTIDSQHQTKTTIANHPLDEYNSFIYA